MLAGRIVRRYFSVIYKRPTRTTNLLHNRENALQIALNNREKVVDWDIVKDDLMANERSVNSSNADAIIISLCHKEARLDIAKSYVDYMRAKSLNISDASVGKLLRMHYHHQNATTKKISAEDEEQIVKWSKMLTEKHEIIEASLAENMIHGLSVTSEWMRSLDLLRHIRLTGHPSSSTYSCIILRALEEDKLDLTWDLMNQMSIEQVVAKPSVFIRYFNKFANDDVETEKMLNYIGDNFLMFPENVIQEFCDSFGRQRQTKIVKISRNGECRSCTNKLPSIKLNKKEFDRLSNTLLEKVLIKKDVFIKTSPEEVEKFKRFVDESVPVGCVIDGLNVAYSNGVQKNPKFLANNIALVIRYFLEKNQTCLVIGRKHMNSWPKDKMDYIRKNSRLFLAENLSQDDPFILYAALRSGQKTNIFTRDLMRGHSFLLDVESRKLFRRWQQQHQYSLVTTMQMREIIVKEPVTYEKRAHKINSFWHIPFTAEHLKYTHESFALQTQWLCLKMKQS